MTKIEIFPITNETEYKKSLRILESMSPKTLSEKKQFEVIAQLVERWENLHHSFEPDVVPGEVLWALMEGNKVTQTELAELLNTHQSNISAILNGKRRLNIKQAKFLAHYFGVEEKIFGSDLKKAKFSASIRTKTQVESKRA